MYFKPKITPVGLPPMMKCIAKPNPSQISMLPPQQKFPQQDDFFNRSVQHADPYRNNPFVNQGDLTMSTTMPTDLINQMMNVSYQQKQQQQQQQYQPPQRFNPMNPFDEALNTGQSFYERNLKFQQQQQIQAMKRDFYNSAGSFSTGNSSSSSLSAYEANMQQQFSMMTPTSSIYNRYEPPKPDTPPSKPLWLDPVWNCDGNLFDNRSSLQSNVQNNIQGNFSSSDQVKLFEDINKVLQSFLFHSSR